MISWSIKKRFFYLSLVCLFLFVTIGVPVYFKFFVKPPSCFDNIFNQNELETDCGGVCEKICRSEIEAPIILFYRYFEIAPGVYNAVALIENSNSGFYATRVPYRMNFYDEENVLIGEAVGETILSSKKTFPIIEYSITTGERKITRMSFEFLGDIKWQRGNFSDPRVDIFDKTLVDDKGIQKLHAKIKNNEVYKINKIPLIALLYDKDENLITSSHTLIDELSGKGEFPIVFTWNEPFSHIPTQIEIIPFLIPRELVK